MKQRNPANKATVTEWRRHLAQMTRTITFGSGSVAVEEGDLVWAEIADSGTTWIYDNYDRQTGKLLYTLDAKQKPWTYMVLVMPPSPKNDDEFLAWYRQHLRQHGKVDLSNAPADVKDAALKLHQLATAIYWRNREATKAVRQPKR